MPRTALGAYCDHGSVTSVMAARVLCARRLAAPLTVSSSLAAPLTVSSISRASTSWAALVEADDSSDRTHVVALKPGVQKIKGIGKVDTAATFSDIPIGDRVEFKQKAFVRLPPRLPELRAGMLRRAQTISAKDAGFILARLGIGTGDRILEAGLGSAGLALHVARCLGSSGLHVTVEARSDHEEVGLANLQRAHGCWSKESMPAHVSIHGKRLEESVDEIVAASDEYDGIILDLPDHRPAIEATAPLLAIGGRLACYCPVTSQLEASWAACEEAGLDVEWAGEVIERQWGRASKGGVRPVNGPFGHTGFLLVAQRREARRPPPTAPPAELEESRGWLERLGAMFS